MNPRSTRHTQDRLTDVLNAIKHTRWAEDQLIRAEQAEDDESARVALDAITYNLVVIGEAINALPVDITDAEPDVPWRDVVDMRNFLSHEYFRTDHDVVRHTIDQPLEQLRAACERLLA